MLLESLGLWTYPAVTGILVILLLVAILSINWWVDYRRNKEMLKSDVYNRYRMEFPRLKKDLTYDELKKYDGCHPETNYRICTAIDGVVFDVTKRWDLYGPDRLYSRLAGNDSSRSLVYFQNDYVPDKYDNLSDLSVFEVENLEEWKRQFSETYPIVGRLLKNGETRRFDYSDSDTC